MRRLAVIGFVAAAGLAAAPASAQFQPVVMKLRAWPNARLAEGTWSGGSGPDLLVLNTGGTAAARRFSHEDLLQEHPSPYAGVPASPTTGAIGWLEGDPASSQPDVAWGAAGSMGLQVTWGESPSTFDAFAGVFPQPVSELAAIRLLPRPQSVLLATGGNGVAGGTVSGGLAAADLVGARGPPAAPPATRAWDLPAYYHANDGDTHDQIYPLRLSPGALGGSVEDAIVPFAGGFVLLWHGAEPAGTTLAALDSVSVVPFGAPTGSLAPFLPGDLATTFWWGSCLGGAAMDVDGVGGPDLVFSYSDVYWDTYSPPVHGAVLWIANDGSPADPVAMAAQQPWGSLMGRSDLAAITDAGTLRPLDLDSGAPAFAVQDRARERLVVVRGDGVSGFETLELPTTGGYVRELRTLDVVGSPAKDLLALVELAPLFTTVEVWVYPDVGDLAPVLAWNPAPPATTPLGSDLTLSVDATDPDSPAPSVTWLRPAPTPAVSGTTSLTIDGAEICDTSVPLDVTVRALDTLGVYVTLSASVVVEERPSLWITGAEEPGRIVLAPGGGAGQAQGEAWPKCGGAPVFTWGAKGIAGILLGTPAVSGSSTSVAFTIPEAVYPDVLDGDAALVLRAVDATRTPAWDGSAALPFVPEASGLVQATLSFDEASLSPGERGHARVRLASAIGVPLPAVRAVVTLEGLAFAGAPQVTGAPSLAGAADGEVIVDPLPAAGSSVEILVPVRSLGGPGAAAVELFSSGGFRVSPAAAPSAVEGSTPGCGCRSGGVGVEGALPALLALAWLPRRRRAGRGAAST